MAGVGCHGGSVQRCIIYQVALQNLSTFGNTAWDLVYRQDRKGLIRGESNKFLDMHVSLSKLVGPDRG